MEWWPTDLCRWNSLVGFGRIGVGLCLDALFRDRTEVGRLAGRTFDKGQETPLAIGHKELEVISSTSWALFGQMKGSIRKYWSKAPRPIHAPTHK